MALETMPLRIRTVKTQTGRDLLEEVRSNYGGLDGLRKHVEKHPEDPLAELLLRDAEYFHSHPEALGREVSSGVTYVSWKPEDVNKLTPERLRLLHELRRKPVASIKALAEAIGRDYKNVFNDLRTLQGLGLVSLAEKGGARVPRLDFEKIEILL